MITRLISLCCLHLVWFGFVHGFAQGYSISGVVDGPDGLPIQGVSIKLFGANRVLLAQVQTNPDGVFQIHRLEEGLYELGVEFFRFSSFQRIIRVPADVSKSIRITLQLAPIDSEVTVTARHGAPEEAFLEPASVRVRGIEELAQREVAHLPRMLSEEPGVLTQETTPGQGSPVLRGQTAQTILYLVDGIRYNNATYRSGNTQYLGWIPSSALDSVEVLLGPAGTQYGSDALGGAIHLATSHLPPWTDQSLKWGGESKTFVNTADLGTGTSLRGHIAGTRLAFSFGGSFRRHQEVRSGGGRDSHSSLRRFLGFTTEEVRRTLGSRLRDTDYAQSGWNAKLGIRFPRNQFLTFHWMQSEEFGVRRFDRLLGGDGNLRSEATPQRLGFGYARYQKLGSGLLRILDATFSINRQTDGQISQKRENTALRNERNRVSSFGYLLSTSWAPFYGQSLTAGAEFYDEYVFAKRFQTAEDGKVQQVRPRFPNGSRYQSLGIYLSDDWTAIPKTLLIESGIRFSAFRFRSLARKNVFIDGSPSVPDVTETFHDLTFNAGLSYSITPKAVIFGRVARGFRAPSVFDLGEQGLTGGGFEISPEEAVAFDADIGNAASSLARSTGKRWRNLKPEVLWSLEGGIRWKTRRLRGNLTLFDSEQVDSIQRRTLIVHRSVVGRQIGGQTILRQDSDGRVFIAMDERPIVSRANIGRIRIQGLETVLRVRWAEQWNSVFKASVQRGRELDTRNYARRMAPDSLVAGLRWDHQSGIFWLEGVAEISGAQTRLNPSELDDPRIGAFRTEKSISNFFTFTAKRLDLITNGRLKLTGETLDDVINRLLGPERQGRPLFDRSEGFATLGLRGGFFPTDRSEISFALMNVTDANFRKHGSGFDAPGINFSLSYRLKFN